MFCISMIPPIQDSPSASQTLIDSTLPLPVAGPHYLPHFLETGRHVSQANHFNQVKYYAQGQTRSRSQDGSAFQRSASTRLGFGYWTVRAAIAWPREWWPPSCSLRINLAVFWCLARGVGNRNKPNGHASVVKPGELAFC